MQISLALSSVNFQSRFISEFKEMAHLIDTPKHTKQGFIVDLICQQYSAFIRQDHGISMKNNNLWLFIDNDSTSTTTNSIVSINLGDNYFGTIEMESF